MSDSDKSGKLKCLIRIINIATGGVLIGFGIAGVVLVAVNQLLNGKFFLIFSPVFMALFGLMVVAAQFKIQRLTSYFGFLQSLIGRGIFNIYLATVAFYYFACTGNSAVVGWIMASILFVIGILYFILHCCGGAAFASQSKQSKQQMM